MGKKMVHLKYGVGGKFYVYLGLPERPTSPLALEQIKPETSLEAKMTKLKLSYFRYILRRQGSLEKTVMLVKIEGSRKRGRPNRRWVEYGFVFHICLWNMSMSIDIWNTNIT